LLSRLPVFKRNQQQNHQNHHFKQKVAVMPASLYPNPNPASLSLGNLDLIMMESSSGGSSGSGSGFDQISNGHHNSINGGGGLGLTGSQANNGSGGPGNTDSRAAAEQIAMQLAMLQQQGDHQNGGHGVHHGNNLNGHHQMQNGHHQHSGILNQLNSASASDLLNGHGASGSLEDLKSTQRRSQNMTECVPVPSSEHVAEIVGRQGCKIKALRAKTNTYIKTPVRGEEPVFVVTGRKEDVALAKREILSAADHFSQIRASRKSNINSTLAFGQLMANTPGQTTVQVRVPYRVVGLVVGPKGATIKRIQQQTHTYIVTPSRDKEPVFEVTGLPENVEAARKEIEAHIAIRTGTTDFGPGQGGQPGSSGSSDKVGPDGLYFNLNDNAGRGSNGHNGVHAGSNGDNDLFSTSGGLNSPFSSSSGNLDHVNSILNSDTNGFASFKTSGITLANLLSNSDNVNGFGDIGSSRNVAWSNGTDSHDSGIGHSPPFDNGLSSGSSAFKSFMGSSGSGSKQHEPTLNGIWGELNKVLGGLDLNGASPEAGGPGGQQMGGGGNGIGSNASSNNEINKQFLSIGSRSSLDLGTLGRPLTDLAGSSTVSVNNMITTNHHTANNSSVNCMGRQLSLPTEQSGGSIGSNGVHSVSGVQTGNGSAVPSSTPLPGFNGILSNNSINSVAASTGVVTSSVTSIYDKTKDTTLEATEAIAE